MPPMKPVLVTWMSFNPKDEQTGGRLHAANLAVRHAPKLGARTPAEVAVLARDAVGAIVSTDPFDAEVFASAPELRVIARVGVGTDSIDLAAATEAGVIVTTTRDLNGETTADHTLALILATLRRVVEHDRSMREGKWERGDALLPWDLHGLPVGIVGLGSIGRAVARRLSGFGIRILAADPGVASNDAHEAGVELVSLDELLASVEIVTLHVPLLAETRGLIGARELALMKRTAILVNVARGGIVDEQALVQALKTGRLRAAALDVFAEEPTLPQGLADLGNVVLSPHIGGISERSIAAMVSQATTSVLDVLAGTPDPSVVANPAVLDRLFAST